MNNSDVDNDSVADLLADSDNDGLETNLEEQIEEKETRTRSKQSGSTPWKVDEKIHPSDWKYKKVRNETKDSMLYLLPNGNRLHGRNAALKYMVKRKFSLLDIQKIMKTLPEEGWRYDAFLPSDWLYKKEKSLDTFRLKFYTHTGDYLRGKERAHNIITKTYSVKSKEFENFSTFCGRGGKPKEVKASDPKKVTKDFDSWKKDECIYPKGWKYKKESNGIKTQLLSPNRKRQMMLIIRCNAIISMQYDAMTICNVHFAYIE